MMALRRRCLVPLVALAGGLFLSVNAEALRASPTGTAARSLVIWDGDQPIYTQNSNCAVGPRCTADPFNALHFVSPSQVRARMTISDNVSVAFSFVKLLVIVPVATLDCTAVQGVSCETLEDLGNETQNELWPNGYPTNPNWSVVKLDFVIPFNAQSGANDLRDGDLISLSAASQTFLQNLSVAARAQAYVGLDVRETFAQGHAFSLDVLSGGLQVNRDDTTDLLLQNSSTTAVAAWTIDNGGLPAGFAPLYLAPIGTWKVVSAIDIHSDGVGDILMQDATTTSVGAFILNGTGQITSFLPIYSANIGTWKVVGALDVNGDGIEDILLQDSTTTWVGVWLMNSAGQVTSFVPLYSSNIGTWKIVATADIDGDGITDIVMQDSQTTWVAAWTMDGHSHIVNFLPIYTAGIGTWKVVGALDLNRDGHTDLILQDAATTWGGKWTMDGTGKPSVFEFIYTDSTGPWRVNGRTF